MGDGEYDAEEGHEVLGVAISPAVPGDVDVEPSPRPLPHLVTVSVSAAGVEFSVIISDITVSHRHTTLLIISYL